MAPLTTLRISEQLELPVEAVTETFAILAKRGAGKTYTASVLCEEMLLAGLQVVVIDPMGAWWGLRSSADGRREGIPVAILGGDRGDVPLEPTAGQLVAELVVGERLSAITDLSGFSKNERRRFVTDFLERLYQRNREAMHVVLEEADLVAPQRYQAGDERMLGAVYDLVRRGRGRGIGSTLITQRSASISKEVLEQAEILVALRTTGPRDRKAIEGWIDVHGDEQQRDEVLASLPSLPTGEAWVWWPVEGILRRVKIRARRTFDSSATPKPGEARRQPKTVADVDLAALEERMRDTIERARQDDPRELRRLLAAARRELAQQQQRAAELEQRPATVETVVERVEVPVLPAADLTRLELAVDAMLQQGDQLVRVAEGVQAALAEFRTRPLPATPGAPGPPRETRSRPAAPKSAGETAVSAYALGLLETLARHHPMRLTRAQISTLSGRRPRSSTFAASMAEITRSGLVTEKHGQYELTEAGLSEVGAIVAAPQTTDELLATWRSALPAYERDLFDQLVDAYPGSLTREELAERAGRSLTSSTFGAAISTLAKNGLATVDRGEVRAAETLFLAGVQA